MNNNYNDIKTATHRLTPTSKPCDHFYNVKARNRFKKCVVCGHIKKDHCNV